MTLVVAFSFLLVCTIVSSSSSSSASSDDIVFTIKMPDGTLTVVHHDEVSTKNAFKLIEELFRLQSERDTAFAQLLAAANAEIVLLKSRVLNLETKTAHITVASEDCAQTTIFTGSVRVTNGISNTVPNSCGNLILGLDNHTITGSHNVIAGVNNDVGGLGGFISGLNNFQAAGKLWASVLSGNNNRALANNAVVVSGTNNQAVAGKSVVVSGTDNQSKGVEAVVVTGFKNTIHASGDTINSGEVSPFTGQISFAALRGAILGGQRNSVTAESSVVVGGFRNTAGGSVASVGAANNNGVVIVGGARLGGSGLNFVAVGGQNNGGTFEERGPCEHCVRLGGNQNCPSTTANKIIHSPSADIC